jgi:hypothetical protein
MNAAEFTTCAECKCPMACRDVQWCHNSPPPQHVFLERVHSKVCHICLKMRHDPIHKAGER